MPCAGTGKSRGRRSSSGLFPCPRRASCHCSSRVSFMEATSLAAPLKLAAVRPACFLVALSCALAGCGGGDRLPEAPAVAREPDVVVTPPVVQPPPVAVDPVPPAYR